VTSQSCGTFESHPTLDGKGLVLRFSTVSRLGAATRLSAAEDRNQNTNVRACRFYERQGCRLQAKVP
jgi:hypothetical protein